MHEHKAGFAILLGGGEEFSNTPLEQRERIEISVGYDGDEPPTDEEISMMAIDGPRVYLYHQPCGGPFRTSAQKGACGKCGSEKLVPRDGRPIASFPNYFKKAT